jgi:hypothetical protein
MLSSDNLSLTGGCRFPAGEQRLRRRVADSGRQAAPRRVRRALPFKAAAIPRRVAQASDMRDRGTALAVNHSLRALTVPGSLHRDPGRGAFNFAEVSFAEFEGRCRDVLLQPK